MVSGSSSSLKGYEMRQKTGPNGSADSHVKEIKRKTRRRFSAEDKIRIVPDGLRGESSISELCRRGGIAERADGETRTRSEQS
jgi:hypothetical protein